MHRVSFFNRYLAYYDKPLIKSSPRPSIKTRINVNFSVCFVSSMGVMCGPGSSVGTATDYGLDGPGSNPGWDEISRPVQTGPWAHPASCKIGTGSFPGVKCGRGVLLTIHPLLVPRSWKSTAIPLPTLGATTGL